MCLQRLLVASIALFVGLACCACGDDESRRVEAERTNPPPAAEPVDELEEEEPIPESAALEAACFEGDREACDQLGH